jgi:hypothetical protein
LAKNFERFEALVGSFRKPVLPVVGFTGQVRSFQYAAIQLVFVRQIHRFPIVVDWQASVIDGDSVERGKSLHVHRYAALTENRYGVLGCGVSGRNHKRPAAALVCGVAERNK